MSDVPHLDPSLEGLMPTLSEISTPTLNVNVEFNELLDRYGEHATWEMLGKLKDLLG